MKLFRRLLKGLSIGLTGAIALASLALIERAIRLPGTLTKVTGEAAVAGLTAPARIVRTGEGIVHIEGQSELDVYRALGVAHAQDRFWQMDMLRRIIRGRVAEVLGPPSVPTDTFMRSLQLSALASETLAGLPSETRAILTAYTEGVNAVLARRGSSIAPEYVLTYSAPEPWRPEDSITILHWLALGLSENMWRELARLRWIDALGVEKARALMPPYDGTQIVAVPELSGPGGAPRTGGSNNWVLSGARTLSGSPLLANDPHLAFTAPSLWYLAHLAMPDGPLVGGTIPGFPTIFLGHNGQAAWGMTNTGTDVQDVVVLALTDEGRAYQTSDGPVAFTTRTEKIGVRFGKDETLSLLSGPFGRALPASSARLRGLDPAETLLGLQWTLFEPGDLTAVAAIDAPKAKDWSSFVTALDDFSVPMQNVVYADASGRIGLVMRSRVPTRPLGHPSRGLYPAPAKAAATTWSGFVSTGELPTLADPPDGLIITANNQIVPDDYPHYLTSEWAPAYRARRLTEQLNNVGQTDLDYSADLQIDNTSLFARDLLPTLLKTPAPSPNAEAVLDTLRGWDGDMHKDRAEPLIFMAWMHALSTAVLADDFGKDYDGVLPFRPQFLEGVVTENPSAAPWCDDQTTDALEPCSLLLGPALVKALEGLEATYGSDREAWRWGAAHEAVHEHLPFAGFPVIDRFFNIRVDTGGGPYTPNQGGINLASDRPFQNRHGAGFRGLYDLSNLDASHFMIATGQSGNPLSKWYRNFSEPWADGVYLTIPTDPEVYRAEAAGIWVLRPPEPSP